MSDALLAAAALMSWSNVMSNESLERIPLRFRSPGAARPDRSASCLPGWRSAEFAATGRMGGVGGRLADNLRIVGRNAGPKLSGDQQNGQSRGRTFGPAPQERCV